jgi:hypothetical protein
MTLIEKTNKAKRVMMEYGDSERVYLEDEVKEAVLDIFKLEKYYINCNKNLDKDFEDYFKNKYNLNIKDLDSLEAHKKILGDFKE